MLEDLFSSKTRVSLLLLFLGNDEKRYYMREISRVLHESLTPVRRELLHLKETGFLQETRIANLLYYNVNKKFIYYQELKSMVQKALNKNDTMKVIKK